MENKNNPQLIIPPPWFSIHGGESSDKLQGRAWSVCFWRKLPCEVDIYNQLQ